MAARKSIKTPRIVQTNNGLRWFAVFSLGAMLGAAVWFGFDYGREWAGLAAGESSKSVRRLRQAVDELEGERDGLSSRVAALERASQIDREATRMAQLDLKNAQDEVEELEKEVEFLRNLVEDGATGALRIKDFKLSPTEHERTFSYRMTVTQIKEDFGWTRGAVGLKINGMLEGQAKVLDMQDLSEGVDEFKPHKIKFRHFQHLKGTLVLPEGFSPDNVTVEVKPSVKKLAPLSEAYDWVVGG